MPLEWLHVMYAANRYELKNHIQQSILKGNIVILNRYFESNICYGLARGLEKGWLQSLDKLMPRPDLTIIIDLPITESNKRNPNPDKNKSDNKLLMDVKRIFLELAREYGWVTVDGNRNKNELHDEIISILKRAEIFYPFC